MLGMSCRHAISRECYVTCHDSSFRGVPCHVHISVLRGKKFGVIGVALNGYEAHTDFELRAGTIRFDSRLPVGIPQFFEEEIRRFLLGLPRNAEMREFVDDDIDTHLGQARFYTPSYVHCADPQARGVIETLITPCSTFK